MVEQQKNLNLEYYNTLSKKYEEARKIIHDIKKHMYALEGMKAIDSQKADDYGKMIEERL